MLSHTSFADLLNIILGEGYLGELVLHSLNEALQIDICIVISCVLAVEGSSCHRVFLLVVCVRTTMLSVSL